MPYSDDSITTGTNVIPFPRTRAVISAEAQADDEIQFVTVMWPRAGLGNSIRNGDLVEIDMMAKAVHHDGVFVVEIDGRPELRRVQRDILDDGSFLVGNDWAPADRVARDQLRVVGAVTKIWRAAYDGQ
ncbi:MAG: hypothetical protein EPO20_15155 [Betaproteobacteria bacterium]|nr:MAG: hypothetical protein EPO20_15155 [Betaproteobacteria bacterium]